MPFNGTGTFVRVMNWVADAAASINITASRVDTDTQDIANGLSACITRDGQGKPSAAINWNAQALSNVQTLGVNGLSTLSTTTVIGIVTATSSGFGMISRMDSTNAYAGFQTQTVTPTRVMDLVTIGSTYVGAPLYGAAAGDTVLNLNTGSMVFSTSDTRRAAFDPTGYFIQSPPTTAPTLATNGQLVLNPTSNTNLRVSYRGTDGVTRVGNITLA